MAGYENFYGETPYSLDPVYGNFIGYRVPAGELGATTSIQTANQLREVTNLLNQGLKNVEVSTINPEVFEMIPDEHLKEINKLTKLTNTETSLHAPVIEPSGFTQQGWDETTRTSAERQFIDVVKRGHQLSPKGNIPVTIHSSAIPGTESIPWKNPETGKIEEVQQKMIAVNRESGEMIPLEREIRYYPGTKEPEKGRLYEPQKELEMANASYWDNQLSNLVFYKERGDAVINESEPLIRDIMQDLQGGKISPNALTSKQREAYNALRNSEVYLQNIQQNLNGLFNRVWKFSNDEIRQELKEASNNFGKQLKESKNNPRLVSDALQNLMNSMYDITLNNDKLTPQIYEPIEDFAKEKASETFSNVALSSYKEFGNTSPIISIENPPYGSALSRGQELKDLVEISRQKFVEKAVKEGISKSEAEEAAKKVIGVTWDTSHISMMKKSGFKNKDLIREAEIVAPYVKHVHFNDNFGSTHTDLPPGMGSAPLKETLKEFEKQGFKGKKVFEGGNFFQHFQTSPHPFVLEAVGSPLSEGAPYWNQMAGTYGSHFAGYGNMLPETHFSTYGAGFSGMPAELGGDTSGRQSRFAGTPSE